MIDRLPENLRTRVRPGPSGCWIWTGSYRPTGYGQIEVAARDGKRRALLAHRAVYAALVGETARPLHHRCHVRGCVRPSHLSPIDAAEHSRLHHVREACERGHPWTEASTYHTPDGRRQCRPCKTDRERERRRLLASRKD